MDMSMEIMFGRIPFVLVQQYHKVVALGSGSQFRSFSKRMPATQSGSILSLLPFPQGIYNLAARLCASPNLLETDKLQVSPDMFGRHVSRVLRTRCRKYHEKEGFLGRQ